MVRLQTHRETHERTVEISILIMFARQYMDALKICVEQHVPMTEELVEKLTPPKEFEGMGGEAERNRILEGVGEVCMAQRQYHLATKKFTQCGNRVKVGARIRSDCS